tara:strand:- start:1777 stop:2304 length:528 start_codon:yes stop_codon:yes gene_type:complete
MASMKKNTTQKKLRIINPDVCDECHLIDCCCEADKLQVIKDEANLKAKGYEPIDVDGNGDIRWVKPEPECVDKCGSCDCEVGEDDEKYWCSGHEEFICEACHGTADKCHQRECDCCANPDEEPLPKCDECDCGLTEDDEKYWCNHRGEYICEECHSGAEKCDDEGCDCCAVEDDE